MAFFFSEERVTGRDFPAIFNAVYMIIILFYSQLHNIEFFLREQEKQLKKCCETTKKRNETLINLI